MIRTISKAPVRRVGSRAVSKGFTLIELMIVVAVIAIILTLALPVYTNYTIRAKVGEALSVAAATKTAVAATCQEDMTLTALNNNRVGYGFTPSKWVEDIQVSGTCSAPVINVSTRDTGASTDPQITLLGAFVNGNGAVTWTCEGNGPDYHLPAGCRSL